MHTAKQKELIVTLIKNDILNNKLITGLHLLGVDASDYYTYLSTTIFELVGFEDKHCNEMLYDRYNVLCGRALHLDLIKGTSEAIEPLASEIYEELIQILEELNLKP